MFRNCRSVLSFSLIFVGLGTSLVAEEQTKISESGFVDVPISGEAQFSPTNDESKIPKRFRQQSHRFAFETEHERDSGPVKIYKVRFPSPVETEADVNNTVHAQYFLPQGKGPFPAVVVLHILGGDFALSQMISNGLARKGVAALFVKMPYYGERRPKAGRNRMLSPNLDETVEGMTQAVLDIRRAATWLERRPEVDPQRLGVMGISLGGIMSGLSAAVEPRFRKVAMYLAGGNLHAAIWDSGIPEVQQYRQRWKAEGETRESFIKKMAEVDPITFAERLKDREILMVNASKDEVIPKECTIALWKKIGRKEEIVWLNAGHYSAALYIFAEMERMGRFFRAEKPSKKNS